MVFSHEMISVRFIQISWQPSFINFHYFSPAWVYFSFVSHSPGDRHWGCLLLTNGQNWLYGCPRDVGKSLNVVDVKGEVWVQCVRTCMLTLERESNIYQSQTYGRCLRSGKSCSSGESDAAKVWGPLHEQMHPLVPLCFWESAAKGAGSWLRRRRSPARWLGYRHHTFEQVGEERIFLVMPGICSWEWALPALLFPLPHLKRV